MYWLFKLKTTRKFAFISLGQILHSTYEPFYRNFMNFMLQHSNLRRDEISARFVMAYKYSYDMLNLFQTGKASFEQFQEKFLKYFPECHVPPEMFLEIFCSMVEFNEKTLQNFRIIRQILNNQPSLEIVIVGVTNPLHFSECKRLLVGQTGLFRFAHSRIHLAFSYIYESFSHHVIAERFCDFMEIDQKDVEIFSFHERISQNLKIKNAVFHRIEHDFQQAVGQIMQKILSDERKMICL